MTTGEMSNLPSAQGAATPFVSKVVSAGLSPPESDSFVPIYFFSCPEITQYPESIFVFSIPHFPFLAKEMEPFPSLFEEKKKLCTMKTD